MNYAICAAIGKRAVIQFRYDGSPRTAEPHCHGTDGSEDEVLSAFQTSSPSGWRYFDVSLISNLRETQDLFLANRTGYNPNDPHIITRHCCV